MKKLSGIFKRDYPLVTLIVAVAALALSQLKPIYSYFESPEFSISLAPTMQFGDNYGSPILQPFIQIENLGDSDGLVNGIEFSFQKDNEEELGWIIPAQTYFETPTLVANNTQAPQVPFKSMKISSGDTWGRFFYAGKISEPDFQEEIMEITNLFDSEFEEIYDGENIPFFSNELVDRTTKSFGSFPKELQTGSYSISVFLLDRDREIICEGHYRFFVRKSHVKLMKSKMEQYKNGVGILFPYQPRDQFAPWVSLSHITSKNERLNLSRKYLKMR